jgi:hypothetical protein
MIKTAIVRLRGRRRNLRLRTGKTCITKGRGRSGKCILQCKGEEGEGMEGNGEVGREGMAKR